MQATLATKTEQVRFTDCSSPRMSKILLVGIVLAVLQQWSGINVIFNYAEEIYQGAGYGVNDILFNIVITGVVNLVFTVVAMGWWTAWPAGADADAGCAGIAVVARAVGLALPCGLKGLPVCCCAVRDRLLWHVAGAGDLGADLGDLPQPHSRRGDFGGGSALWIACFILTYTFPVLNRTSVRPGLSGFTPASARRDLCSSSWRARNQRQDAGADRTRAGRSP